MSFTKDLIGGADGKFDHNSLSALQKVTLRAVVMSFLFYGLASIEGMIMRMVEIHPRLSPQPEFADPTHFF